MNNAAARLAARLGPDELRPVFRSGLGLLGRFISSGQAEEAARALLEVLGRALAAKPDLAATLDGYAARADLMPLPTFALVQAIDPATVRAVLRGVLGVLALFLPEARAVAILLDLLALIDRRAEDDRLYAFDVAELARIQPATMTGHARAALGLG